MKMLGSFIFYLALSCACSFAESNVCQNGQAGIYPCQKIDLLSRIDTSKMGLLNSKNGSDVWGWVDPKTGHEVAIMGHTHKTSFIDITDPKNPIHLGDLPSFRQTKLHRDIKVYKNHAYIVSEAMGHGLQVFDLTQLPLENPPKKPMIFQETTRYRLFGNAHNIAINEESGFAYVVGSMTCDGGLHIIDIANPEMPFFSTCVDRQIFEPGVPTDQMSMMGPGDESYTHDVQCVIYRGSDLRYLGKEICIASNDDSLNIVDVTDKSMPYQISALKYPKHGFVHQGWLVGNHQYFLLGDELDEMMHGHNTRTYIIKLDNLERPQYLGYHEHQTKAIDHNLYTLGQYVYMANYKAGLRILKMGDLSNKELTEVAYFDVIPEYDSKTEASFGGAWTAYPYFPSGNIIISSFTGELFVVRPHLD